MKHRQNEFIKYVIKGTVFLTLIITVLSFSLNVQNVLKIVSFTTFFCTFIIFLYTKYLWKVKKINFFKIPNLNGEYYCELKYKNSNKEIGCKVCKVEIIQDLLNIQINLETDEINSYSFSAEIINNHGYKNLYYMYKSISHKETREENPDKLGAVWLRINSEKELSGEYFTNVGSSGIMTLKKIEDK